MNIKFSSSQVLSWSALESNFIIKLNKLVKVKLWKGHMSIFQQNIWSGGSLSAFVSLSYGILLYTQKEYFLFDCIIICLAFTICFPSFFRALPLNPEKWTQDPSSFQDSETTSSHQVLFSLSKGNLTHTLSLICVRFLIIIL